MKSSVWEKAERFLRERKDYKRWLAVVACLAVLVTLGTVTALKNTGSAMTHKQEVLNCRYEVHKHTPACYDAEGKLICGYADVAIHQHNDDCYDAEGKLVCTLPEVKLHKQHEAPCYTEQSELVCGLTEGEDHTHSDSCYTRNELLTCTQIAQDLHTHDGNCYDAEGRLICGLLQLEEHVHNADCIETVELNDEEVAALNEQNASGEDETSSEAEESATAETAGSTEMTEGYEPAVLTQTAETENYVVTVSYTAEANIPENAVLQVIEYARDSERFLQRAEELGYEPDWLLNIGFYADGTEIEPESEVSVKVVLKGQEEIADYNIVHFTEKGAESLDGIGTEDERGAATEFVAESFSDFSGSKWTISGPTTVEVGKSISLTSKSVSRNHSWSSDNEDVATVIGSGTSATVTGVSAGTVTITHTWRGYYGDNEEQYTVTVTAVSSENPGSDIGGSGLQEVAPVSDLVHEKYVKANEDGTYELTLNVKGAVASATDKAKLDIVFVVDTSRSMTWEVTSNNTASSGKSRLDYAKSAIKGLLETLTNEDSGIDARYKLISFSTKASDKTNGSWKTNNASNSFYDGYVSKLSADGGTNYEAALKEAGTEVSSGSRENAKTIVVFLTDGIPTLHGRDGDSGGGTYTTKKDYDGAITGASTITCDYFFAVGYGKEMNDNSSSGYDNKTAKDILNDIAAKVQKNGAVPSVSSTTNLSQYFEDFIASLTTIHAVNVSFTDRLTNEVNIVTTAEAPSAADWVIKITDKNGNDVTETEKTVSGMTVSYDSVTKRVNVSFNQSYELKKDYTYSITTKIQPNDAASALYASNNYTYPHLGDANTDAPGNATSSNKYGIYCNVDNSAKVNYSYIINDGTPVVHDPLDYPRPVVQFQTAPVKPPQVDQKMSHNKYVEKVDDNTDTYNLTLDVAGQVGSVNQKAKYDIMFVVDTSASMNKKDGGRKAKIDQAKDAIIQLIDNLDRETSTIDARYNLVSFGSTASNPVGWKSGDAIKNTINGLSTNGGTNYQQGLAKAAAGMSESRLDATAVVIFMTDGQPTWHVCKPVQASSYENHKNSTDKLSNDGGACRGGGSDTAKTDYEGALMGAGAVSCNYFYAVGFGNTMISKDKVYGSYTAFDIISNVAQATNATIKKPTVTTDLATYFEGVLSDLQKFYCTNVTVTDTLSQWAEVSDPQNAMLKIAITDKDGNVIRTEQGTVASGVTMTLPSTDVNKNPGSVTATYSSGEKKIVLQFPTSYQLEEGYTYSVTVEIKPTQKAYEYYVTENGYPHTGDLITDKPGLDESQYISSGKKGFYSNDSAVVTYSYNGGSGQESYLDPVITVTPATLNITKTVEGLTDSQKEELLKQLKFTVDTNNSIQVNAVTNSDNTVSYVYSELVVPNVSHSVAEQTDTAEVFNYDRTTTSTVTVDSGASVPTKDGINASIEALAPGSVATVAYTNTYELHKETIQLVKVDEKRENVKDVEFTLTEVTDGKAEADKITYSLTTGSDGVAYYMEDGTMVKEIVLTAGSYLVTETSAPSKYFRISPFQLNVGSNGVSLETVTGEVKVLDSQNGIVKVEVTNSIAKLDELQILKVSSDGGTTPLPGAKFTLYDINPNTEFGEGDSLDKHIVAEDITTGDDGKIINNPLNNLFAGEYWLVETQAPNGYHCLSTSIDIQIYYSSENSRTEVKLKENQSGSIIQEPTDDDPIWTVVVYNNTGAELPKTGGPGTILYTFGGIAVLAIGLLYGFSMRRMRERRFR